MTPEEILALFKSSHALLNGHFELTSGLHSAQYFQCAKVLQFPLNAEKLCREIVNHFLGSDINLVIAPALGGMVVGQEVGRQLGVRTIFTERKEGKMQLRRGFSIMANENVLVCEDVITTGGSVKEVIRIVHDNGARVIGVGAIVSRGGAVVQLPHLFATFTMDVVSHIPSDCPLCKDGIPLEKPGSKALRTKQTL